jgi:hypothetical protein
MRDKPCGLPGTGSVLQRLVEEAQASCFLLEAWIYPLRSSWREGEK